ncbi:hypothetical protein [Streptomyces longwoodensis]|uniref:hypothetical protein n=1 Tax=Streptomyces longwoodensis TaxID=68231 RepID=UPI0033F6D805
MAGFAAASIGLAEPAADTPQVGADTRPLTVSSGANNEFDKQLGELSDHARDSAHRASRAQGRVDLEHRR